MVFSAKELNLILQEGEGYRIEFKERVSNLDREMVAFANSSGGRIFIGVSDKGDVVGINLTNELKSQVQDIANNCDPPVKILLHPFNNILIVEVRESIDKPCKCASGFYNRIGPNAQKMSRNDIVEFLKSEGKIRFDELVNSNFKISDLDLEKFKTFLAESKISAILPLQQILKNLALCEFDGSDYLYNNTATLFFAKNLSFHYYHTAITCAIYKGNEKATILDRKDFNFDLISNINEAMLYVRQHLKVSYQFDGSIQRHEVPETPFEAIREALVNAVVQRDYFQKGANVMVEIFDDRFDITSPGGLPKGLLEEEFGTKSLLRNPNLANLFLRCGFIEKWAQA